MPPKKKRLPPEEREGEVSVPKARGYGGSGKRSNDQLPVSRSNERGRKDETGRRRNESDLGRRGRPRW